MKYIEYNGILFKLIPDHPMYAISQCGKILSRSGIMKPSYDMQGKPKINYPAETGAGYCYLNRLVWRLWTDISLYKSRIIHVDGDKSNCHLSNLQKITRYSKKVTNSPKIITIEDLDAEDVLRAPTATATLTKKHKLSEKQIEEIVALLASMELTQQQIADRYGVARATINRIKNKRTWAWKI